LIEFVWKEKALYVV